MKKVDRDTCEQAFRFGKTIFFGYLDSRLDYNINETDLTFDEAEAEAKEWFWNEVEYYILW